MADPIDLITANPDSDNPTNFATEADLAWTQLKAAIPQINTVAKSMNLNSINDTSLTTNTLGTGSKTFTVSADKSFVKGMILNLADTALPGTNFLTAVVTAYSGTSLTVNVLQYSGTSGTSISDWTISFGATPSIPTVSSEIKVTTLTGRGSTNTKTLLFSTTATNTATADITYSGSASLGSSWTILVAGWYRLKAQIIGTSTNPNPGFTLNSTQLSTSIDSFTDPTKIIARCVPLIASTHTYADVTVYLAVNDVVRIQDGSSATLTTGDANVFVHIQKISLQGTGGGGGGGSGAPDDAQYVVAAANGTLTNERVATSSTSILTDTGTAGQMKYKRAAITGDVAIAEDANSSTIGNNIVTNAKLATMAAKTVKGNSTASAGNAQDLTLTGGLSMATNALKSKGSFGFTFAYSTTTTGDPGSGGIRPNNTTFASITAINISVTSLLSRNLSTYEGTWASGGQLCFISNNESSNAAYGIFDITANTDNTSYRTLDVTPVAGVMPANGEELIIFYYPPGGSGLTTQDVLDMKVVRTDVNGQLIDETGVVISGSPAVADYTALVALDEAVYSNFVVIVESGLNRSGWISNGTTFTPFQGQYVQERTNTSVRKVIPANAAITWTAANNGSGKVRLTSSAAHGLTTSPAVGASMYLISGGTGWTADTYHEIATIVSTTQIDLTTTYTTSMGVPVFALAGDEIPLKVITLPVLRNNSVVIVEFNTQYTADATGSSRRIKFYLDATELNNVNSTNTTNTFSPFRLGFKNLNSVSSQLGLSGSNSSGYLASTLSPLTAAVDTSTAKTIKIAYLPASGATPATNLVQELLDYTLIIRG